MNLYVVYDKKGFLSTEHFFLVFVRNDGQKNYLKTFPLDAGPLIRRRYKVICHRTKFKKKRRCEFTILFTKLNLLHIRIEIFNLLK